jgi:hypothetical protein
MEKSGAKTSCRPKKTAKPSKTQQRICKELSFGLE